MFNNIQDYSGKTLGGCRITGKISKGGMGVVYKAEQLSLSRTVAIKVLSPHLTDNEEFISRFFREAESAALINHPNVLQVYDVGKEDGIVFMVTEFVEGKTLSEIINEKGAFSEAETINIARDIACALEEAHLKGIVHRDIKPHNIMITDKNVVKVMDFGLAKNIKTDSLELTQAGALLGTPRYMSPEQIERGQADIRSDIYSLGLVLFYMLTGKPAYDSGSDIALLNDQLKKNLPSPKTIRPDVSDEICGFIIKMTRKKPIDRFQSPKDIVTSIDLLEKDSKAFSDIYKKEKTVKFGIKKRYFYPICALIIICITIFAFISLKKETKPDYTAPEAENTEKLPYAQLINKGEILLKNQHFDESISIFEKALKEYPDTRGTSMWLQMAKKKREKHFLHLVSSELVEPGKLTVLICQFSNFYYKDENGDYAGHDIELMKKFAEKLQLSINFIEVKEYKDLIPELLNRKADMIASGMTMTKERIDKINFSEPYFTNTQVLVLKSGTNIGNKEDLSGKVVGYLPGTSYEKTIKNLNIQEAIPFKGSKDMVKALIDNKIDAYIDDLVSEICMEKSYPEIEVAFTFDEIDHFGFGVSKSTPNLKKVIDSFIKESEKKGLLKSLYKKYFAQ